MGNIPTTSVVYPKLSRSIQHTLSNPSCISHNFNTLSFLGAEVIFSWVLTRYDLLIQHLCPSQSRPSTTIGAPHNPSDGDVSSSETEDDGILPSPVTLCTHFRSRQFLSSMVSPLASHYSLYNGNDTFVRGNLFEALIGGICISHYLTKKKSDEIACYLYSTLSFLDSFFAIHLPPKLPHVTVPSQSTDVRPLHQCSFLTSPPHSQLSGLLKSSQFRCCQSTRNADLNTPEDAISGVFSLLYLLVNSLKFKHRDFCSFGNFVAIGILYSALLAKKDRPDTYNGIKSSIKSANQSEFKRILSNSDRLTLVKSTLPKFSEYGKECQLFLTRKQENRRNKLVTRFGSFINVSLVFHCVCACTAFLYLKAFINKN
ncbi:hypothetical protein P9112_012232 [Eukaryota sp. TZLM1-RC]